MAHDFFKNTTNSVNFQLFQAIYIKSERTFPKNLTYNLQTYKKFTKIPQKYHKKYSLPYFLTSKTRQ